MHISPISNNNHKQGFSSLIIKDNATPILNLMSLDELKDIKKWANELENTKEFDLVVNRNCTDLFVKYVHKTNIYEEDSEGPLHYAGKQKGRNLLVAGIDLLDPGDWFYYDLKFKNKKRADEIRFNLKELEYNHKKNDTDYNLMKWAVQGIKYLEEGYGHDIEKKIASSKNKPVKNKILDLLITEKEFENRHSCTLDYKL